MHSIAKGITNFKTQVGRMKGMYGIEDYGVIYLHPFWAAHTLFVSIFFCCLRNAFSVEYRMNIRQRQKDFHYNRCRNARLSIKMFAMYLTKEKVVKNDAGYWVQKSNIH